MRALLLAFATVVAVDAAAQTFRQERAFATQLQDAVRAQNREGDPPTIPYLLTLKLQP